MKIKYDEELNELATRKGTEALWEESDSGWSSANAGEDSSSCGVELTFLVPVPVDPRRPGHRVRSLQWLG